MEYDKNDYILKERVDLVAKLLDIELRYQFFTYVKGQPQMVKGIMQFNVSDYQKWIDELNGLTESERFFRQAQYQGKIFNMASKEMRAMQAAIENMYYN